MVLIALVYEWPKTKRSGTLHPQQSPQFIAFFFNICYNDNSINFKSLCEDKTRIQHYV